MAGDPTLSGEPEVAADLVRRIASGDATAESEMVDRYSRGLLFMLRRATFNPELAEDLHQEAFRIVLERLRGRGLAEPERLVGFLHGTARKLSSAEYRKSARRRTESLGKPERSADPSPGQLSEVLLDEEAALVRRLIADLEPERDRQILYRFYIAEERKAWICGDLALSSLHFNRVLHRARQRFKRLLEGHRKRERLDRRVA